MLAMTSYVPPDNHVSRDRKNCTIASIFEKEKSFKFELLFGEYFERNARRDDEAKTLNVVDYHFLPGMIFGYACESFGADYQRFHHVFILRACSPGELGNIISGIIPGAEVLVRALTGAASLRLRSFLKVMQKNNIDPAIINEVYYRKLNHLLDTKMNIDYLVGELIAQKHAA